MPRETYDLFFRLFDASTLQIGTAIRATPERLWREQPEGMFGPGELILHHIQSERFGAGAIATLAQGEELQLDEPFASIAAIEDRSERMARLRELNLNAARAGLSKFSTLNELVDRWEMNRQENVRAALSRIRPPLWNDVITHPLIPGMTCDVATMCFLLFLAHPYYHVGQGTTLMKVRGESNSVPFIFGVTA